MLLPAHGKDRVSEEKEEKHGDESFHGALLRLIDLIGISES